MNLPLSKAINEYSGKMEDLFQFLNQQEVADVYAGKIPCLSEKTRTAMDPHFRAASTPLGVARKEVVNLMSELNDIQVQKST